MEKKELRKGLRVRVTNTLSDPRGHPGLTASDVEEMKVWLGKMVTITGVERDCGCCRIAEDDGDHWWAARWFQSLDESEQIELANDTATLVQIVGTNGSVRRTDNRVVSLRDFVQGVVGRERGVDTVSTPLLPPFIRHYSRQGDREVVVFEQPPHVRTIRWKDELRNSSDPVVQYQVALPFVVMVCGLVDGRPIYMSNAPKCFYRTAPITSLGDRLYHTSFQNVSYSSSWLCLHPQSDPLEGFPAQASFLLGELWDEPFTNNMAGNDDFHVNASGDTRLESIESWAQHSKQDPLFVLGVRWKETEYTVEAAVARVMKDIGGETPKQVTSVGDLADIMYQLPERM